jgi:hypothetical protein
MVRNVQQLLKNQRRDMGKLNRALSTDMRRLQKALTEEPTPTRAKGTTTRGKGRSTTSRSKGTTTRGKGRSTTSRSKGRTTRR